MARNMFGGSTAYIMDAGKQAWDDTDARIKGITNQRTTVQAGRQLAAGDRSGAGETFARGGMIAPARQMAADQSGDDERDRQHGREDKADERADFKGAEDRYTGMTGVLGEISAEPEGRRLPVLQQRLELFQHLGYPPELIQQLAGLTEADLTNDHIRSFGGKLENEWKVYQTTRGGLTAVNQRNMTTKSIREPDKTPPPQGMEYAEDGETLRNIPGYVPARREVAGATRAPPRARASGGGGGGGLSGFKTEDLIAALGK